MHVVTQNCLLITEKKSTVKISRGLSIEGEQIKFQVKKSLWRYTYEYTERYNLHLRYFDIVESFKIVLSHDFLLCPTTCFH